MKRILLSFSLLALLLVSTAILADGRPTGIRIGRAVSGGGASVSIDITVPGTDLTYDTFSTYVWLGNTLDAAGGVWQYASPAHNVPLPWAIDWGDSDHRADAILYGPPGGPFRGTFEHTYVTPGTYLITAGDAICCSPLQSPNKAPPPPLTPTTGNSVTGSSRYVWTNVSPTRTFSTYNSPIILAVTANATVTTGTGIPALNVYGLLAMGLVLVGTGLLVYRRPQRGAV